MAEQIISLLKEILPDEDILLQERMEKHTSFRIGGPADVFVMPSKREGLPVASLEAMYVGLPLITSRCRGIVDVMEDGVTGYIHSYDDSDGIAESIAHLRDNTELRAAMGEENKHRVIPFCLKEAKEEVLKIIVDVLR
jgi:glycosyltransferase involved in cell wall biosynthesis